MSDFLKGFHTCISKNPAFAKKYARYWQKIACTNNRDHKKTEIKGIILWNYKNRFERILSLSLYLSLSLSPRHDIPKIDKRDAVSTEESWDCRNTTTCRNKKGKSTHVYEKDLLHEKFLQINRNNWHWLDIECILRWDCKISIPNRHDQSATGHIQNDANTHKKWETKKHRLERIRSPCSGAVHTATKIRERWLTHRNNKRSTIYKNVRGWRQKIGRKCRVTM